MGALSQGLLVPIAPIVHYEWISLRATNVLPVSLSAIVSA
jgi:hypothetical protein